MRGLAQVGIIALVDEATGYQKDREADELSKILAAYINEELRPWVKKEFKPIFFQQIYRLHGWEYKPGSVQRPQYIGKLINRWIYDQLPKVEVTDTDDQAQMTSPTRTGVLEKLQELNPVTDVCDISYMTLLPLLI